jgi:hypothetical protein
VNDDYEDVVAYSDIVDYIEQDDHGTEYGNQGDPKRVQPSDPDYMGSMYNTQLLWETGEVSWEPLHTKDKTGVYNTDQRCHLRKHGLLGHSWWKLPGLKKRARPETTYPLR